MVESPKVFMPDDDFFEHHITFTSTAAIAELVTKLANFNITYFTFERVYQDNSHLKLTNSKEWIKHYYQKKLYEFSIFEKSFHIFNNGVIFWSWLNQSPIYLESILYNINHGITIIDTHEGYCNFYHFGTDKYGYYNEMLLYSRIGELYNFIALFNHKALHLIKAAELNRFILPMNIEYKAEKEEDLTIYEKTIKRFYLGSEFNNRYLTPKELQIINYLSQGKKLVEITQLLFISKKTSETHINNIKTKLQCKTMFELGTIAQKLGILNLTL